MPEFEIWRLNKTMISGFRELIPVAIFQLITMDTSDYILLGATTAQQQLPCGVLIAAPDADGIRITHLFVSPKARNKGIGTKLLTELITGMPTLPSTAQVSSIFAGTSEEKLPYTTAAFFAHLGFEISVSSEGMYITTIEALREIPFWQSDGEPSSRYLPFSKLPAGSLQKFNQKAMHELGLLMAPYADTDIDQDISHALIINNDIEGIAVITDRDDLLELAWLYFRGDHVRHVPGLLRAVYRILSETRPGASKLRIELINDASEKLARKLCPHESFHPFFHADANFQTLRTNILATEAITALTARSDKEGLETELLKETLEETTI